MINDRKIVFVGLFVFHKLMMSPQKSDFRKHGYSLMRVLTEAFGVDRTGKGVMPGVRVLCQVNVCHTRCMYVTPDACVLFRVFGLFQLYVCYAMCCARCIYVAPSVYACFRAR